MTQTYCKETTDGVWLLNAGIIIEQGATLYINSTDTSWLKIAADGQTAYPILVSGSLKIDCIVNSCILLSFPTKSLISTVPFLVIGMLAHASMLYFDILLRWKPLSFLLL